MLIFFVAVVLFTIVTFILRMNTHKKMAASLKSSFGEPPDLTEDCDLDSISLYSQHRKSSHQRRLDDITWNDLDMDKVFRRINVCLTSVGEEYLYNTLHELRSSVPDLIQREALISFLGNHPEERLKIQMCLAKLGKEDYNGLSSLLLNPNKPFLKFPFLYKILALLPLLSALLLIVNLNLGLVCLMGSLVINVVVYYITKIHIETHLPTIIYFISLLHCCRKLCSMESLKAFPQMTSLKKAFHPFKSMTKLMILNKDNTAEMDISEYISILFLINIRNYNTVMKKVAEFMDASHSLYKAIGEIDLSLSVLSFRKSLPFYTTPDFGNEKNIDFQDIYHPLIPIPVCNSALIKNSLITGANASGKSTFIKTLAINGILAQTLYTCSAKRFKTWFSLIMTSMALRDDMDKGDSYFIVEIRSLKRILDAMSVSPCTCYIDEILRGTNTIERIAASAAVLKSIRGKSCLCIAASHDIELTDILAAEFDNFHFSEHITGEGILPDYKLRQGPSQTRNAIKLLGSMGFDTEIVRQANAFVLRYEEKGAW